MARINSQDISWPPATIEDKVKIFYERALGWQLHIADLIANGGQPLGKIEASTTPLKEIEHSGFAVLQICLSYFETVGNYQGDCPKSKECFKRGVRSVLPQLPASHGEAVFDELVERLYKGARCGLYHNSMTVSGVGLGQPPDDLPIGYDRVTNVLAISPERLPRALKAHLERFRDLLLNPKNVEVRQNFERRFNADSGISEEKS